VVWQMLFLDEKQWMANVGSCHGMRLHKLNFSILIPE
jgi:hypothetical protein